MSAGAPGTAGLGPVIDRGEKEIKGYLGLKGEY